MPAFGGGSPGASGARGGGMVRTPADYAMSLDSSRPSGASGALPGLSGVLRLLHWFSSSALEALMGAGAVMLLLSRLVLSCCMPWGGRAVS